MLIDNRDFLRFQHRSLLERLSLLESQEGDRRLTIEASKTGAPTLKVAEGGKTNYIHSKYDPEAEAEKLVDQIEGLDAYNHVLFIGTGIGYQIKALLARRPDLSYSIYEPDLHMLEQFLSHQVIAQLSKNGCKRIIATDNENEIQAEIKNLHDASRMNILVFTLPACSQRYDRQITIITETLRKLLKQKRFNLGADVSFQKRWTINSIKNFPKVLETPNVLHHLDKMSFEGKPAIIIAAGPSLNEEYDNLRIIKEKGLAYLFSVGSAINSLIEHDIYPDAACTYDPTQINQVVFQKLKERKITNIPLIFGSSVGFETLTGYPGKMLHMFTSQDTIAPFYIDHPEEIKVVRDAPSIAVVTFELLYKLGFGQIILVGQNLGFQNNNRYAEGISYVRNELTENEKKGLLTIKDVFGNEILTSEGFNQMRQGFEAYIRTYRNVEVINTTNGGAHIEGAAFMRLSELIATKWHQTNIVNSDWYASENTYDMAYVDQQILNMRSAKIHLEQIFNQMSNEIRGIDSAVKMRQTKELQKKFPRLDKEIRKLRQNAFFKVFIEPMVRVHFKRLIEESQTVRFENDLTKKGNSVVQMFTNFIQSCQAHLQSLTPYVQEFEERIQMLQPSRA